MPSLYSRYRALAKPAKAAIWFLICGVLQRGVSVLVTPLFTRIMSTEDYGLYTLFNSWLDLLGVVVTLRLSWGVFMQGLVRYDDDQDQYTSALQGLTTLLVLAGVVLYLPFRRVINEMTGLNTFLTICAFASAWATAIFGFWSTRQRLAYNYRALVAVTLAVAVTGPVAGVLAVLSTETFKVEARVICIVIVELAFYSVMFFRYMLRGRCFYNKKFWGHALRFNVPLVPHYLSQSALSQAGRVMIGSLVGASAAAIFGLASSISGLMLIINQAILNALNPWIYQRIRDKRVDQIARVSYLSLGLVGAANLCLIAFAPEVVALFAPSDYQPGVWAIPPLAASSFITFMYSLFADFEFYYERTTWVAAASIAGAALVVVLNWALIPAFGFLVAAWTTLAGYTVYVGMHYAFMRRVQIDEMDGVRVYDPKVLLVLVFLFGAIAAVLAMAYPFPLVRYAFLLALMIAAVVKRRTIEKFWLELRGGKKS